MDDLPDEVEALRGVRFFEDLTPEDLDRIASIGQRRSFEAGDAIVSKDDDTGGLYVLLSGTATVDAGGTTHTLRAGDFTGEMGLLARKPGLVVKSTRSTNEREACGMMTNTCRALMAISHAPPDPGRRTFGRP